MKVFSSPVVWIFLGAFLSALAAITAAIAGWTTLRQQDVQIETVKAWMTGGDSIVYFEPLRRDGRLAFYIRHASVYPAYDVTVRVHEVLDGRDRLVDGPLQVGTVSGGSGMDYLAVSPTLRESFPDPPLGRELENRFRIEIQTRNGLFIQRLRVWPVQGRWHTDSRTISGGAFDRGVRLPEFREAQDQ